MFPQLVAGPIVRYRDVSRQIFDRTINRELFSSGCLRFITGLGKKVLIANTLAVPADKIFAIPAEFLTPGLVWLGITCYTLQIYFDFSGYSDMAIGLGRMLGFKYPENFNYPYFAKSIQDFWRRWHISLSSWFRDYLYFPLGGNRRSPYRTYFNLVVVFLLCGLWHGASWVFIIWGLYHGAFLVFERMGLAHWLEKQASLLRHIYVMLMVMGGWVLFRSETVSQAIDFYCALIGVHAAGVSPFSAEMYMTRDVVTALITGSALSWPLVPWTAGWYDRITGELSAVSYGAFQLGYSTVKLAVFLTIAFWSVMSVSGGAYNPFIYFRF